MSSVFDSSFLGEANPFKYGNGRVGCVLVHGFTGTPWALRDLGQFLAEQGVSVSAPLLPGHGTKPKDLIGVPWSVWVESCRREAGAMLERCDEIFLLGHSMGGSICLLLASRMCVHGVISLSAPVLLTDRRMRFLPFVRPFVRYWKKKHHPSRRIIPEEMEYDRYPLAAVSELVKLLKCVKKSLAEIDVPVLIMHAKNDYRVPESNADFIFEGIRSQEKRKILLDNPCHSIMHGEDQKRVREEVLNFIRSQSSLTTEEK